MNTTQKQPPKKKKPAAKKKTVKRRKINAKNMAMIIVSVIVVLGLIGGSAGRSGQRKTETEVQRRGRGRRDYIDVESD